MDRSATVNDESWSFITVHGQFKSKRLGLYCQVAIWPRKHKRKTPSQAFTRSKQIYRIGRSLKFCGKVHRYSLLNRWCSGNSVALSARCRWYNSRLRQGFFIFDFSFCCWCGFFYFFVQKHIICHKSCNSFSNVNLSSILKATRARFGHYHGNKSKLSLKV